RELNLDVWTHGRTKTFIRILSPAKEAGIGTLRVDTNMWNYLPDVEKTIKIPPSMMFQPWMGSDFTNDDLVKESSIVEDYTHRVLGTVEMKGEEIYKIELIPKPEAAVTWGKLLFYIRAEDLLPVREKFYDEDGTLIKVLNYSKIEQMSDRKIPTHWEMESKIDDGHRTIIEVLRAEYNQPHSDGIYTMGNLKQVQ
ncbi:MAG: outer membrane lipoprotein-sorting protein, partial [Candidatus Omnitrophica bacterium]|nr:outer membrane lipoprotein-sorting protein [Candidatus Omnitrophota bacterium]